MKSEIKVYPHFPRMLKARALSVSDHHPRQGFTLMELVIVLALMGIMAGMIIPEMKGSMEDSLLRSSGRTIVDLFNMTYSRAISLNELLRVRLDTTTGNYVVERQMNGFQGPNAFEPIEDVSGFQGQIDPRIAIEIRPIENDFYAGEMPEKEPKPSILKNGITFYQDGTTDGCEILLRDRMGVELVLQLDPITATVRPVEQELP
jgi:prepilin-type N-terminal cleavage/methylation domain-containing protein